MRHDLLPLPISPRPPGVREVPGARVLVVASRPAQARPARLLPARLAAVPLAAVAAAAQQHLALAQRTREHPPGSPFATLGPDSRHRRLRSEPTSASGKSLVLERAWTMPVHQCNTSAALCALHGGVRRRKQLACRLCRRTRSRFPRRLRSTPLPMAPTLRRRTCFAYLHRRLVHGGGRASHPTNARPPRWASRVRRIRRRRIEADLSRCRHPVGSRSHAQPGPSQWVSFGERRWVSFGERQRTRV